MFGLILAGCASICLEHYYQKGFDHADKRFCWCAEAVKKDAPTPLEINLQWKRTIPEEDRKAEVSPVYFPRYSIPESDDE